MPNQAGNVVVTGLGPVTSIGVGSQPFWEALTQGRCNVRRRTLPLDLGQAAELPVASMPPADEVPGLAAHLAYLSSQDCPSHRDLAYTLLASELALSDAGLPRERLGDRAGLIQVFEAPGVEHTVGKLLHLLGAMMPADAGATPSNDVGAEACPPGPPAMYDLMAPAFYSMQPFLYVHLHAKALGLHGFCTSVHNACSSGAFALEAAVQRIRSGQADVMIVAGGEAFETAVRLEWFRRLQMYAADERMRPFDSEPTGFYVGEGAAALVLESAEHAARRGAEIYATYLGGAFAHQGWKQTIPDMRSTWLGRLIGEVLKQTGVSAADLDLIVPHGAATQIGDGYEAACLNQSLGTGARRAVATAFKPAMGHMLAASGLIESIGTLLAMKHQYVPATLHTRPGAARLPVPLVTQGVQRPIRTALKLATGFTGHDAALLWRTATG